MKKVNGIFKFKEKKMYHYYITWKSKTGHGATVMEASKEIETYEDINAVRNDIQTNNPEHQNIIIWDWKPLKA